MSVWRERDRKVVAAAVRLLRVVDLDRDIEDALDELTEAVAAAYGRVSEIVWCSDCNERPGRAEPDDDPYCGECREARDEEASIVRTHRVV